MKIHYILWPFLALSGMESQLYCETIQATWVGTETGGWWEASNWSNGSPPGNTPTDRYNVHIDGGNTSVDATVLVSGGTAGINTLQIDAGDSLQLDAYTAGFLIDGTDLGAGEIVNDGLLSINGDQAGEMPYLSIKNAVTLNGTGLTHLQGNASILSTGQPEDTLTIQSNHSISTSDSSDVIIGDGDLTIINRGTISSQSTEGTEGQMQLLHDGGSINVGLIEANGGQLHVTVVDENNNDDLFLNNTGGRLVASADGFLATYGINGGSIEALDQGIVYFSNVKNATFETSETGRAINQFPEGRLETLTNNGNMEIWATGFVPPTDESYQRPTFKGDHSNNGHILLKHHENSTGEPYHGVFHVDGTVTLGGTGELELGESAGQIRGLVDETPDILINEVGHTIISKEGNGYEFSGETNQTVGDGTLTIINKGMITTEPNGSGEAFLRIIPNGNSKNEDTIRSNGGMLLIEQKNFNLSTFLDNSGGLIEATGSSYLMAYGVENGTIRATDNATVVVMNVKNLVLDAEGNGSLATGYEGSFESLTINSPLTFPLFTQIGRNSLPVLKGDWINNSIISITDNYENEVRYPSGLLEVDGTVTLSGNGELELKRSAGQIRGLVDETPDVLINEVGHTIISKELNLGFYPNPSTQSLGDGSLTIINRGTITTQYGTLQLLHDGESINEGLIEANGGQLYLTVVDENNDDDLFLDNTDGRLVASADGFLATYGINGGSIEALDQGIVYFSNVKNATFETSDTGRAINQFPEGRLESLTNNGNMEIWATGFVPPTDESHQRPTFKGDHSNNGHILLKHHEHSTDDPYHGVFHVDGTVTLSGNGELELDATAGNVEGLVDETPDILINESGHTIRGLGTIGGSELEVENRGILAPGLPIGEQKFDGSIQFTDSAKLEIDLGGLVPGTEYDRLNLLSGTMTLAGVLEISLTDEFAQNIIETDSFTIISCEEGSQLSGGFLNVTTGGRILTQDDAGSFKVELTDTSLTLSDYQTAPVAPPHRESWTWLHFGDLNPATEALVWGALADPDRDGKDNDYEYIFGFDPNSGAFESPTHFLTQSPTLSGQWTVRLRQRTEASNPNLQYTIFHRNSLSSGDWDDITADVAEQGPREAISDEIEWVKYLLPASEAHSRFIKVQGVESAPE